MFRRMLRRDERERDPVLGVTPLSVVFAPGAALMLLGLVALLFPRLVIAVVAAFLFLVGAVFCIIGWKFLQLRKRVSEVIKEYEGRVYLHTVRFEQGEEHGDPEDHKKVTYH